MKIPITRTDFTKRERDSILEPVTSGWVVQGPFVRAFEEQWNTFTGATSSIAVTSCTTALTLSLYALGIGKGDEVIVPAFTWIATANAVETLGAKPVFCDIDLQTFNIDTSKIERLITSRTKAIIPVHLFGLASDMDEIMKIARKRKLLVIEDAACGFGSWYKKQHVGTFGITGCFSFHPRKAITTGEGGMVTTNNKVLAAKLRALRDHGAVTTDFQRHKSDKPYILPEFPYAGFNFRMTDIQAALGASQMRRAKAIMRKRQRLAKKYDSFFEKIPWLRIPFHRSGYIHGYQSYVCLFQPNSSTLTKVRSLNSKRNKFMQYLQEKGIATRPGTHAVHMLDYYRKKYSIIPSDFPNAYIADQCSVAFPFFQSMKANEFNYIAKNIMAYSSRV